MSMNSGRGHGKNFKSYPHRKGRGYRKKPNSAKEGRKRFYNRPPPNGDYRARIEAQKEYIKGANAVILHQTEPVSDFRVERVERLRSGSVSDHSSATVATTESGSIYSRDEVHDAMDRYCPDQRSCISCDLGSGLCIRGDYSYTNPSLIKILEDAGYLH